MGSSSERVQLLGSSEDPSLKVFVHMNYRLRVAIYPDSSFPKYLKVLHSPGRRVGRSNNFKGPKSEKFGLPKASCDRLNSAGSQGV